VIGWLLALLVWTGCLLLISWRLLVNDQDAEYLLAVAAMVATSIPIVRGIVAEVRRAG